MDERQQLKTALVRELMTMPPHQQVEYQGRRQPAHEVLKSMFKSESAAVNQQASQPWHQDASARGSLTPTEEALAALSPEDRAKLESGEGLEHLTRSATPRVHVRQVENSGVTQTTFHTDPASGKVVPGSTPAAPEADAPKPAVRSESGAPSKTTYRQPEQRTNPWALIDK